ncbi:MAG: glycosyl hydrolase [Acidobacteriota bacterium]
MTRCIPILLAVMVSLFAATNAAPVRAPEIREARGEHQRVVLSFAPVAGAKSYELRYSSEAGVNTIPDVQITDYTVHGLKNGTTYRFEVAAVGPQGKSPFSAAVTASPTAEMSWAALKDAFRGQNPTRSSCPFWMLHGKESDEELRTFLDLVYRFGCEGVTIHPYLFEGYLGEGQWHRWQVIVEHARKLGLAVWQLDDKDYPSGWAGGAIVREDRRLARWEVTLPQTLRYQGPADVSIDVGAGLPSKQQLVSVAAFGPDEQVKDLTDLVSDNRLKWSVPEGNWEIFVIGTWQPGIDDPRTPPDLKYGEVRGYIDPLSEQATDLYVETIMGAAFKHLGPEFGKTWKGFFIDEPGFLSSGARLGVSGAGYPFTPDLLARFQQRFGYSLRPLLPSLWINRGKITSQARHDYMELITSEYGRLFVGKLRRFAEEHGTQLIGHLIEGPPMATEYGVGRSTGSTLRTLESFSMGGFDSIFDQWFVPDEDVYWRQPKLASSVSHYMQTPLDEALVEHFAATGWRTGLTEMKAMTDWTTCRGVNRIVPGGLDTQEPPVWENVPEIWLKGKNPLAPYFHSYQLAANRATMLIRGGRHVARALLLDPASSAWVGPVEDLWKACKSLSQAHFDYDIVSYGVFTNPSRCRIDGKRLLLGQEDCEFVIFPGAEAVPLAVLERLQEFCDKGGTVIWLGGVIRLDLNPNRVGPRFPGISSDRRHDGEVRELAQALWLGRKSRAFRVTYRELANLLYSLDAHDVWIDPNLTMLQYYHRRLSGRDLYFINNEGYRVNTEVKLRGARGVPELWDPVTGQIRQAPCYKQDGEWLSVRLELERFESVFIVINPGGQLQAHLERVSADEVRRLEGGVIEMRRYAPGFIEYSVSEGDRTEATRVATAAAKLSALRLQEGWSRIPLDGNAARYSTSFDWVPAPGKSAELRVDGMTQVVRVRLNGEDLGMKFSYPFRFDLSGRLRSGRNTLEIEHVERHTFESKLGEVTVVPFYFARK